MESLMILVLVIAAVLAVFIKGAADERVKQRRQKRKIHEGFGAVPDRDYSDEELSSIPGYFSMHQEPEQVDDITWNDLGMDQLFFRMNQTYSSAGQEYLYYLLRTPQLKDAKALDAMEEKITCFGQQEQMREQLQYAYMQLGRSGKYSVYDYLNYLDNLGERSSLSHIICDLLLIPAIGMVIVSPPIGMMFLFLLFTVNIFGYMKQKHEIEPYLTSFAYVSPDQENGHPRAERGMGGTENTGGQIRQIPLQRHARHARKRYGRRSPVPDTGLCKYAPSPGSHLLQYHA